MALKDQSRIGVCVLESKRKRESNDWIKDQQVKKMCEFVFQMFLNFLVIDGPVWLTPQ
jgi:hypothetical protein